MRAEEITGKQITTEEQTVSLTIKTAVPFGMPGKVNYAQSAPKG